MGQEEREDDPCPCPSDGGHELGVLVVDVGLEECWALGNHSLPTERSALGELLSRAKYGPDPGAASRLAQCMAWWAIRIPTLGHSRLGSATIALPVPANPRHQPYHLPDLLGEACARALSLQWRPDLLTKVRRTAQAKLAFDRSAAEQAMQGAFVASGDVAGKTVLLVDDVVHTGATLVTCARALTNAGAAHVVGFAGTRATKGIAGRVP